MYMISGLDRASFAHLFDAGEQTLRDNRAVRVLATSDTGFPCRVSLADAREGDELVLVHHVSNDVETPFRMAHAIYVRRGAQQSPVYHDAVPTVLDRRTLGLRAFDRSGMMARALLAMPGEADAKIRELFADAAIAYIHAHNAAYGCFLAAIERDR